MMPLSANASGALTEYALGRRLRAVSGETVVREVVSAFGQPHPDLLDLKLAEVALLRRMNSRLKAKRIPMFGYENLSEHLSTAECEGILIAGGIASARHSIVRLEGRRLIRSADGEIVLVSEGIADSFTYCLSHDPLLVAAYRKVTLAIDKVIRPGAFETLIPDYVSYEHWLASLSL
jgi:hypothetical protein